MKVLEVVLEVDWVQKKHKKAAKFVNSAAFFMAFLWLS